MLEIPIVLPQLGTYTTRVMCLRGIMTRTLHCDLPHVIHTVRLCGILTLQFLEKDNLMIG